MERRVTRRSSAVAATASTMAAVAAAAAAAAAVASPVTGRGRGRGRARRGRGRGRSAVRSASKDVQEALEEHSDSSSSCSSSNNDTDDDGDLHNISKADEQAENEEQKQKQKQEQKQEQEYAHEYGQEGRAMEVDSDMTSMRSHVSPSLNDVAMEFLSDAEPPMDNTQENSEFKNPQDQSSQAEPSVAKPEDVTQEEVFEEMSSLPFISPSFPPRFAGQDVEPAPLDNDTPLATTLPASQSDSQSATAFTSLSTQRSLQKSTASPLSVQGVFFREDLFNQISIGGTAKMAEFFYMKKRLLEEKQARLKESQPAAASGSGIKRQRIARALGSPTPSGDSNPKDSSQGSTSASQSMGAVPEHGATAWLSEPAAAVAPASKFDISDLVASVTSYVPEIASALHSVQVQKPSTDPQQATQQKKQQQPQDPQTIQMKPATARFQHPCIYSHDHRSMLSREEHRRYLMYDAITRGVHKNENPPQLGPEDRAIWAALQEKVDQERQRVRQWNAEIIRSRIISFFNPAIEEALQTKFKRARTRVKEEYPRHYDFVQTIGLRLPSVPSANEPTLSRKKADVPATAAGSQKESSTKTSIEPNPRGLLKRRGKICPVSLAKPIWPTDENGVPYEKTIDVNDRYWSSSESSAAVPGARMGEQDYRRKYLATKVPASSVANDPTAQKFVKEQNVQIAFAASALEALARTLPSLASEWEIPVKVVLEEDQEGVMHKRVYVDKPLIRKRMSLLEMTQTFYDGAIKRLALVASSSSDASILSAKPQDVARGSSAPISKEQSNRKPTETLAEPPKQPITETMVAAVEPESTMESRSSSQGELKEETQSRSNEEAQEDTKEEVQASSSKGEKATEGHKEEKDGVLGSSSAPSSRDTHANDGFEYSLWTFGETRILIRSRIHGYLNNSTPCRQVVLKAALDYAPEIGLGEASKAAMAGWWISTWIRDDRLVALGHVDVSKNQFVRYPDPKSLSTVNLNPENPLGGVFSDLPAISILDASALRVQDREIRDWIKPNMRLIHYIIGKLTHLGPGQYILGHKRGDMNANIYKAAQEEVVVEGSRAEGSVQEKLAVAAAKARYDLHAAHQSSPQLLQDHGADTGTGSSGSTATAGGGGAIEDELQLQWIGTPDQIPGTFPYEEHEPAAGKTRGQKGRGGGGGGGGAQRGGGGRGRGKRGRAKKNAQQAQQ